VCRGHPGYSSLQIASRWDNIDTRTPQFEKIRTWTEHLGHSRLRAFTDQQRHFWLEQNPAKASKWAKLARQGYEIAWEFDSPGGAYTGRMLIDDEIYTPAEAMRKFFKKVEPGSKGPGS
jgi:hypothetical protein